MNEPNVVTQQGIDERWAVADAIRRVVEDFEGLRDATSLALQAEAMIRLCDSMHDLSTWHPHYNYKTGAIEHG